MTEKRYKSQKYIRCYCAKDEEILVGGKLYGVVNIFFMIPACLTLSVMVGIGETTLVTKLGIIAGIILLPLLLALSFYRHAKKIMLKAGHTESCSRKVAKQAAIHYGLYSEFRIIEKD